MAAVAVSFRMEPPLFDLFGEIPVTREDVETWIDVVPGFSRTVSPHRRAYYARAWNVPAKIRAAKLSGFWREVEARKAELLASVGA